MTELQRIHNMNPRRLRDLLQECIAEIGGDEAIKDFIRKEKAIKIEDIMRGYKIAQIYCPKARGHITNPIETFDLLYELDLDTLEAYSKAIDKLNTAYMQTQVAKHNGDDNGWLHLDIR